MFGTFGLILVMSGSVVTLRQAATTCASSLQVRAELRAAFLDVRAGDVQFQRADAAERVEPPRDLGVFLDGRAPDVDDRRHFQLLEERPVFFDEAVHARPLQADGVQHAAGDFGGARRGIAGHGIEPDALDRDRAKLVQVNQPRIFRAVAERAGGHRHRILHRQFADLDG